MIEDGALSTFTDNRYDGWSKGVGAQMLARDITLSDMAAYAVENDIRPAPRSGRQEFLENYVTRFVK